jgi:hypothetical protein
MLSGWVLLLSVGCTRYTPIKPTELPKLNQSDVRILAQIDSNTTHTATTETETTNTTIYRRTERWVQRADGSLVDIMGPFDVRVRRADGSEVDIEHPVVARLDENRLRIRGGNVGEIDFGLPSAVRTEVVQVDWSMAALLVSVGSFVTVGALTYASW